MIHLKLYDTGTFHLKQVTDTGVVDVTGATEPFTSGFPHSGSILHGCGVQGDAGMALGWESEDMSSRPSPVCSAWCLEQVPSPSSSGPCAPGWFTDAPCGVFSSVIPACGDSQSPALSCPSGALRSSLESGLGAFLSELPDWTKHVNGFLLANKNLHE